MAKKTQARATRPLKLLLACQDFAAGMHALGIFDNIILARGKRQPRCEWTVWKFEFLAVEALQEMAVAEAAQADMVIISLHAPGNLPPVIPQWVSQWTKSRSRAGGSLVLLLDDTKELPFAGLPVEMHLQDCARRAGLAFSVHKTPGRHAFEEFPTPGKVNPFANEFGRSGFPLAKQWPGNPRAGSSGSKNNRLEWHN